MEGRLTFGMDIGLTGAIVTLLDGEPGPMVDMPVMGAGGGGKYAGRVLAIPRFLAAAIVDDKRQ